VATVSSEGTELDRRFLHGDATVSALDVDASGKPLLSGAFEGHLPIGGANAVGCHGDLYVARLRR
jgi:hypothetical protein